MEVEIDYVEDPSVGDELIIKDNAFGMDYKDFQRAIILDRPPANTKGRNEFGMGLKALLAGLVIYGLLSLHVWVVMLNIKQLSI